MWAPACGWSERELQGHGRFLEDDGRWQNKAIRYLQLHLGLVTPEHDDQRMTIRLRRITGRSDLIFRLRI